jgi:hypothetical protein
LRLGDVDRHIEEPAQKADHDEKPGRTRSDIHPNTFLHNCHPVGSDGGGGWSLVTR